MRKKRKKKLGEDTRGVIILNAPQGTKDRALFAISLDWGLGYEGLLV
jgi:hypothetical protein